MQRQARPRLQDLAGDVVPAQRGQGRRDAQNSGQVHARVVAHQFQHVHQFFRADVAAGTRRIRASAQSAQRRVEAVDARFQRRQRPETAGGPRG
ncbi:hypothetical protein G6F24_018606 [Rhizopus arrhizus]|nr:hypothetical protein G6F24_018606 [Rhizopus arrhizus]